MIVRGIALVLATTAVVAGFLLFQLVGVSFEAEIYRDRLSELARDNAALRDRYNQAVRQTAVTELVVTDGALAVVVRTLDGSLETIQTPFDPAREIYVDYVVREGRLWIRRIFDDRTPPGDGVLVDASIADIDWSQESSGAHGKAAYRQLSAGRWVVTVTGDGSLGLAPATGEPVVLAPPPPVRRYPPVADEAADALRALEPREVAERLARKLMLALGAESDEPRP